MPYEIEIRKYDFTASKIRKLLPVPHIHTHIEMIYLVKGKSVATSDNQEYLLTEGDLFLTFPNQIHFYHDKEPIEAYLLIFSFELFRELKEGFQNQVPQNPVIHKEQMPSDIEERMEQIFQKLKEKTTYGEVAARGYLLAVLGEIFPMLTLMNNMGEQDAINRILTYCADNYLQPITLESMARELYLSKYYISHIFRERMRMSYKDFVNGMRVDYAQQLLQKESSITEIAYASGFSSVRTFNRAFLKHIGMSPREYKATRTLSSSNGNEEVLRPHIL